MQKIFKINIGFIVLLSSNCFYASVDQHSRLGLLIEDLDANPLTKTSDNNFKNNQFIDTVYESQEDEDAQSKPKFFGNEGLLALADAAEGYMYKDDKSEFSQSEEEFADNEASSSEGERQDYDRGSTSKSDINSDTEDDEDNELIILKFRKTPLSYAEPFSSGSTTQKKRRCYRNWVTTNNIKKIKYTDEGEQCEINTKVIKCMTHFLFRYCFIRKNPPTYQTFNLYIQSLEEYLSSLYNTLYIGQDFNNLLNLYNKIAEKFFNISRLKQELIKDLKVSMFLEGLINLCQNFADELEKIISTLPGKSIISVYSCWIQDYDELTHRLNLYDDVRKDINLVCENMSAGDSPISNTSPVKTEIVEAFYRKYDISIYNFETFLFKKGYYTINNTTIIPSDLLEKFQKRSGQSSFPTFYNSNRNIFKFLYYTSGCNKSAVKKFLSKYQEEFKNMLHMIEYDFINIRLLLDKFNFLYKDLQEYLKIRMSSASAAYEINDMIIKKVMVIP